MNIPLSGQACDLEGGCRDPVEPVRSKVGVSVAVVQVDPEDAPSRFSAF